MTSSVFLYGLPSIMACAFTGPISGNASSCSLVAVLRFTFCPGASLAGAGPGAFAGVFCGVTAGEGAAIGVEGLTSGAAFAAAGAAALAGAGGASGFAVVGGV